MSLLRDNVYFLYFFRMFLGTEGGGAVSAALRDGFVQRGPAAEQELLRPKPRAGLVLDTAMAPQSPTGRKGNPHKEEKWIPKIFCCFHICSGVFYALCS